MLELAIVTLASLFAGFVDAIVGGGGLVLVPVMFSVFPNAAPATLFGTNKGAAVWGTAWATLQFSRRVQMAWSTLLPAAAAALAGSALGACTLTQLPPTGLRKALPFILLAVFVYTLAKKEMGREHRRRYSARTEAAIASVIGLLIGFYDGFFGPGTGSFFVFLFVRLLGYDFLHASASAKLLNTATNVSAVLLFAWKGHVWWHLVVIMAIANVMGSLLGTRLALKHGSGFVRVVFMVVVGGLLLKTGYDAMQLA